LDFPKLKSFKEISRQRKYLYYLLFSITTLVSFFVFLARLDLYESIPPANIHWFMTPFRHAREEVLYRGEMVNRTEIGCFDDDGTFHWRPFSRKVIAELNGPHHRKIYLNAVLSNFVENKESGLSKSILKRLVCTSSEFSLALNCSPKTKSAGIRNFTLLGRLEREKVWPCEL
jgi:hypothetical protein